MITCELCGETVPADAIIDHLRLFHPDRYEEPESGLVEVDDEPEGIETARISIARRLTDDDVIDHVTALDGSGNDLPLTEALGMLRLAEDTLLRERMEEDGGH